MILRRDRPRAKSADEMRIMRRAGRIVADALAAAAAQVRPGVSTAQIDAAAAEVIAAAGAAASFRGYRQDPDQPGFPAATCISVNDEIGHGIPGGRVIAAGDLVSIDCGAVIDGFHGDAAVSVCAGEVAASVRRLDADTRAALWAGIAQARVGGRIGDISAAIERTATQRGPYGIVTDYVGHGIGTALHEEPDVPGRGRAGHGPRIRSGWCLAIEPMLTLGGGDVEVAEDGWTTLSADGSTGAHWEHTVAITDAGLWVLTAADGGESELTAAGLPYAPLAD